MQEGSANPSAIGLPREARLRRQRRKKEVPFQHDGRRSLQVIGDDALEPRPQGIALLEQMLDDLGRRELLWRRMRSPEVDRWLLFGGGHPFKQSLEVVHLGNTDAEMAGQPIADGRLADPGRSAEEENLPLPLRQARRFVHENPARPRLSSSGVGGRSEEAVEALTPA